jgi:hypothetical protein
MVSFKLLVGGRHDNHQNDTALQKIVTLRMLTVLDAYAEPIALGVVILSVVMMTVMAPIEGYLLKNTFRRKINIYFD